MDGLTAILDMITMVPFAMALFLVGAFAGWLIGGPAGGIIGAALGVAIGLWLDLDHSKVARHLRLPVAIGAVIILVYAFMR